MNPNPTDAPFDGQWWIPDDPARVVSGRLELDGGVWRLVLFGWLGPWSDERTKRQYPSHIHGKVGAMHMTLIDTVGGGLRRVGGQPPHRSELVANTVLAGLLGSTDSTFQSASVQLLHLNDWAHRPPWSEGSPNGPGRLSVTYTDPGRLEAILPRATATLYRSGSGYFDELVSFGDDLLSHYTMTSNEWVRFDFEEPTDLETIEQDYVRPLLGLLELATADQSVVLGLTAVPVGADERESRVTVLSAIDRTGSKPRDVVDLLFTRRDVAFQEVLPAWWRLHDKLDIVIDLVQALQHGGHLGSQFFTAVTAVEAYHRRTCRTNMSQDTERREREMSQEDRARRERILRAVSDQDRDWLKEKLYGPRGPSFVERIDAVVTKAGDLFPTAVGDVQKWETWVKKARHAIAHRDPKQKVFDAVEGRTMLRVTPTLQWLLTLVLLDDLDIPADVATAGVRSHQGFAGVTANLRRECPEWFT
jgi:hypothetical protein